MTNRNLYGVWATVVISACLVAPIFAVEACKPANDPAYVAVKDATCAIAHAELPDAKIKEICAIVDMIWPSVTGLLGEHRAKMDARKRAPSCSSSLPASPGGPGSPPASPIGGASPPP